MSRFAYKNWIVDHTNYSKNKLVIDKLNSTISDSQKLGFFLALYLIISSIIILFNTIRLAIFVSKEEIGVMRLVGASKAQVRGPFLIEGAISGVIATFVTLLIFNRHSLIFFLSDFITCTVSVSYIRFQHTPTIILKLLRTSIGLLLFL